MGTNFLQLPTQELLDKIGAGGHKPGSGSAAAFNGILSSRLLLTVIELTLDPKRGKTYSYIKEEFQEVKNKITHVIGPRLEELFDEDAKYFDKAIEKRIMRDEEPNQKIKNDLHEQSLLELKRATEVPLEIAKVCIQLAKYSIIIFNKGFRSARGDAGVALGSSLAGLTGCISIISLNLQSFPKSSWTDSIQQDKKELKRDFQLLHEENLKLINYLDDEAVRKTEFLSEFISIRTTLLGKSNIQYIDIENLAKRIQNALWEYREIIWFDNPPEDLLGVLKPEKVIKHLKYAFHKVDTIGVNENNEEIAGIINNRDCTITISGMYTSEVVNFTTAHELGHALLHDKLELHRDIPLDGSNPEISRTIEEKAADKFSVFFLMPQKIVIQLFYNLFQLKKFTVDEETVRLLNYSSVNEFRKTIKTKRDLSRLLAQCNYFGFRSFNSLAKIFQVSTEAMAIRLEELELIELNKITNNRRY